MTNKYQIFRYLLIILFFLINIGWVWQGDVAKKNAEGAKLYSEEKFDEALSKWRDAQIEDPDNKELHYNIGNALHQQKKYEDAFGEYEKALDTEDVGLQTKAYYNMGNTHYMMGKLLEALEDYKKCLDINPDDEDAKFNIEFIRRKLKENLEKKEDRQQETQMSQDEEDQKTQKDSQSRQENYQKEGRELEKSEETRSAKNEEEVGNTRDEGRLSTDLSSEALAKEEGTKDSAQEKVSEQKDGEMSKEDAIRLLDALKDDEKDLQKELKTQHREGGYRVDKDW